MVRRLHREHGAGDIRYNLAVWMGLQEAKRQGIRELRVEMDSLMIYNLVSGVGNAPTNNPVVRECKRILQEEHDFKVHHVMREANKCADWMATWVLQGPIGETILEEPPRGVIAFHLGTSTPRTVPARA